MQPVQIMGLLVQRMHGSACSTHVCLRTFACRYLLCSITLTLMLPYTDINPNAAFSQAFVSVGMK